jgi:hypothetical protein
MHGAIAVAVVVKRFERQRAERGLLLGKHHGHLPFGRAVDARIRPPRLPAIQVRLRRLKGLEAKAPQRRLLGMADTGFHVPFAIGIADAARERDDAVVRERVPVQRIERRVVHVRGEHALAQIVQDDDADGATESVKHTLVQLRPHLRARAPHEQPHRLARVAQREHEEPRAPVRARGLVADHRPLDHVELIGISKDGARILAQGRPSENGAALTHTVAVPSGGLVLRARGFSNLETGTRLAFYTNPIRVTVE